MKPKQGTLGFPNEKVLVEVAALIPDWLCPACHTGRNSQGEPFLGSRPVALHIAGKIRFRDSVHVDWALRRVGQAINDPFVKRTINTLADALRAAVVEDNRMRRDLEYDRLTNQAARERTPGDSALQAYAYLRELETGLHEFVRTVLVESYGEGESWWVDGVPTQVRAECAKRREEDPARDEVWRYTYLLDLKTIVDKNWATFEPILRSARPRVKSKKEFLDSIARANEIRNKVAHPIRTAVTDEDVSFLRWLYDVIKGLTSGGA